MFMAHLDTVERAIGAKEIYLSDDGIISTHGLAVLGADDGAGIGILATLLAGKVPALYLFTQGEETGGRPAEWASRNERARVSDIDRIISFDRKGTKDICGEQMYGTMASREFVEALADGLGLGQSWACGTYTDNSEFRDHVTEIVNVSVGYQSNHGPDETLDLGYYRDLQTACLVMPWETLPTIGPDTSADFVSPWPDYSRGDLWQGIDLVSDRKGKGLIFPQEDQDEDGIIREALWDICDSFLIDPSSYEAGLVQSTLETMAYKLRPKTKKNRRGDYVKN